MKVCKICKQSALCGTLHLLGPAREPYHAKCLHEEKELLRNQVTLLQAHNTTEVERRRKAEALVGTDTPLHLILAELTAAKRKYPQFANSLEQGLVALASEQGELASAILKGDLHGPHGVMREAAQVAAVALRIIEMAQKIEEAHNA